MQEFRTVVSRVAAILLTISVGVAALGSQTQSRAEQERQREQWQRVSDILRAMDIKSGAVVGDIGAGDGFFTTRLAAAVGPSGRVFAVDIDDSQIDRLRRRLSEEPHRNITVTKGTAGDPRLPERTLDAALIVNAYHEMAGHQAMLTAIRTALKPTGRLVIVEPISETRRTASRAAQIREHEIASEFALQEVRSAGFRIIGLEDPFTTRGAVVEWMLTVMPRAATPAATVPTAESTVGATDDWRDPGLRISAEDLERLARSGEGTLIDVRDEGMFAKGHIPHAVLIPLDAIEASADRLRGLKRPFVTYCS
jgi:ubiquinone/menaquinone biosynthesis C-methylase UbiE